MAFAISDGKRKYFVVSAEDEERLILEQVPNEKSVFSHGMSADVELLVEGVPNDFSVTNVYNMFRSATDLVEVRLNKDKSTPGRRFTFLKFHSNIGADETAVLFGKLEVCGSKLIMTRSFSHKTLIIDKINENLLCELIRQDLLSRTELPAEIKILQQVHKRHKWCFVFYNDQETAYQAYTRLFPSGTPTVCGYSVSVEPIPLPYKGVLSRTQFRKFEVLSSRDVVTCRQSGANVDANGARLVASPIHADMTVVDLLSHFGAVAGLVEVQLPRVAGEGQHTFALLRYDNAHATQAAFQTFHDMEVRGQKMAVLPEVLSPIGSGKKTMEMSLQSQQVCITDDTGMQWFDVHQSNGQHIGRLVGVNTDNHPELYIASLDTCVSLMDMLRVFTKVSQLSEVRLMIGFSGLNRGFAFVRYKTVAKAAEAMKVFQKAQVFGKRLAVQKSTNSKSLLVRRIPLSMDNNDIEMILKNVTPRVSSVYFFGPVGRSSTKYCLINYVDHRSATTARRKLIPHCCDLFGCKLDIDWAPVSGTRGKQDNSSHLEDQLVKILQSYIPKF